MRLLEGIAISMLLANAAIAAPTPMVETNIPHGYMHPTQVSELHQKFPQAGFDRMHPDTTGLVPIGSAPQYAHIPLMQSPDGTWHPQAPVLPGGEFKPKVGLTALDRSMIIGGTVIAAATVGVGAADLAKHA